MRNKGFEPLQALSYESLNLARLTTPAIPLNFNLSAGWENSFDPSVLTLTNFYSFSEYPKARREQSVYV